MTHLLPVLAIAEVAGILAADSAWLGSETAIWLAVVSATAARLLLRSAAGRSVMAAVLFFGLGAVSLAVRLEEAERHPLDRSQDATVEASVCRVKRSGHSVQVELCRATSTDVGAPLLPSRLLLSEARRTPAVEWLNERTPGERVRLRLRLRPLTGLRNPGRRDSSRTLLRRGIGARAALVENSLVVRLPHRDSPPLGWLGLNSSGRWLTDLRRELGDGLVATGRGGQLLRALAVGDRSAVDDRFRAAFRELGLSHLLAVSGLHLALVTGLAYGALRRLLLRWEWLARRFHLAHAALLLAAWVATGYAILCGFEIPVRRALAFVWAVVLALVLGRRVPASHILALASIAVFTLEPGALFEAGAQLSFAATAALLTARDSARTDSLGAPRALERWTRRVRSLVRTSAVAVAATAPILACHGGVPGMAALVCNVIAVPWTAVVLLPAALLAALASATAAPVVAPIVLWAAEALARASLATVVAAAALLPDLAPLAPPAGWALLCAGLLALASLAARGAGLRLLLVLALGIWLRLAPARVISPEPARIVALDVGQGDALLVQGVTGTLLVDGGRAIPGGFDLGRSAVLPALTALGVESIDVLIASHADLDHSGGLASVLDALPVAELWLPAAGRSDAGFEHLVSRARARGVAVRAVSAQTPARRVGDLQLTPLWPAAAAPGPSSNDRSLVVRVEVAGRRILLTGDLGQAGERRLLDSGADLGADVLKVAHHGSATSSSREFLEAVGAGVALLSAPCGGRVGLPNGEVMRRLRETGVAIGWTGRDGALFVAATGPDSPLDLRGWGESRTCRPPLPDLPPAPVGPAGSAPRNGPDDPPSRSGRGYESVVPATKIFRCHG